VNDADYMPPFAPAAKLGELSIEVDRPKSSPGGIATLEAAIKENAKGD
jgi:hypothetical protein